MRYLILTLFLLNTLAVTAQKLPNKQETSLWAPGNIRIDGKADEWDYTFRAYNHATDLFYILANDDANLYLIIRAADADNINKIYSTGLVFEVGDAKAKQPVSLTFPVFTGGKANQFVANIKDHPNPEQSQLRADSFMNVVNKQMTDKAKWIRVGGTKEIDTLIGINNRYGIRAASLFDRRMGYTIEMALPLKYLKAEIDKQHVLNYHIRINPIKAGGWNNIRTEKVIRNGREVTHVLGVVDESTMDTVRFLQSATDFSGEYMLATAP